MSIRLSSLIFLCLLSLFCQNVNCYTRKGHEIFDLEYNTSSFSQEAANWNLTFSPTGQKYSFCGNVPLLGGLDRIGSGSSMKRTYDSLPPHNTAIITLTFYFMERWTYFDGIQVNITSPNVNYTGTYFTLQYDQTQWIRNICGASGVYGLAPVQIYIATPNVGSKLTLDIRNLNGIYYNPPQFGIRDVKITFHNSTYSLLNKCGLASPQSALQTTECPFYSSMFENFVTGQYDSCDSSCDTCIFGSGPTNCLFCKSNYFFDGVYCNQCDPTCKTCLGSSNTQCLSCNTGEYLYSNSTCLSSCAAPYTQRTENEITYCDAPCNSSSFSYSNGSCLSSCPSPFLQNIQGTDKFCDFPCGSSSYLYEDGSCSPTCSAPYTAIINGDYKYCNFPCQSSEYLYFNGSCQETCDAPFQSYTNSSGKLYCLNPCASSPDSYLYWNGSCLDTCSLPLTQTTAQGINFCINPCSSSHDYLYWNGSCIETCPAPFMQKTEQDLKLCNFPCQSSEYLYFNGSCQETCYAPFQSYTNSSGKLYCLNPCASNPDSYLYWDGSCIDVCPLPLAQTNEQGINFCNNPCNNSNDYLYWDGSCLASCPTPLIQSNEQGVNFCNNPCSNTNDFLYWNGSCLENCPAPLSQMVEQDLKLCSFPCDSGDYLYWNRSCRSSCAFPLIATEEAGKYYCNFPCSSSEYLYEDGICRTYCQSPMQTVVNEDSYLCEKPCSNGTIYYPDDNTCKSDCPQPYEIVQTAFYNTCQLQGSITKIQSVQSTTDSIISAALLAKSVISLGDSGGITVAVLAKMLQYIKFIDANYPDNLEVVLKTWNSSFLSLPFISEEGDKDPSYDNVPVTFAKWGVEVSFLGNFWEDFVTIVIVGGVLIFTTIIDKMAAKSRTLGLTKTIIKKMRIMNQNFFIVLLYDGFGDVIFFSLIQFQALRGDITPYNTSILASCLFIIGGFAVLTFHLILLRAHDKVRKQSVPDSMKERHYEFIKKGENFSVFFKEFKNRFFNQQAFLFFFVIRAILFNMILALLYKHPIVQAIFILILNVMMLGYLIIKRPLKEFVDGFQHLFCEVILLIVNISVFVMCIQDQTHFDNTNTHENLGNVIIVINLIFNLGSVILLAAKGYVEIKEIWRERKIRKKIKIAPQVKIPAMFPSLNTKREKSSPQSKKDKQMVFREIKLEHLKSTDIDEKINPESESEPENNGGNKKLLYLVKKGDVTATQGQRLLDTLSNMDQLNTPMDSIIMSDGESRYDFKLEKRFSKDQSQFNLSIRDLQPEMLPSFNNLVPSINDNNFLKPMSRHEGKRQTWAGHRRLRWCQNAMTLSPARPLTRPASQESSTPDSGLDLKDTSPELIFRTNSQSSASKFSLFKNIIVTDIKEIPNLDQERSELEEELEKDKLFDTNNDLESGIQSNTVKET